MQARRSALISAAVLLVSCDRDAPPVEPTPPNFGVSGLSVSPASMSLVIGATGRLSATVVGVSCREICNAVAWASSDSTVASVHADSGIVVGRREGRAIVTARWLGNENFRAASQVTVTP